MKRIIVCCDGTWNADDLQINDTNVAVLARAIHGSQQTGGTLQIVLYVRGVGSLGIPSSLLVASNKEKFAFHDTNPSPLVKRAVQALAIDEHRRDFTPTFWTGAVPQGSPSSRCGLPVLTPISAAVTKRGAWLISRSFVWPSRLKRRAFPLIGGVYPTRRPLTPPHPLTSHRRACLPSTAIIQPYAKSE
jgi:hypothetical protein